MSGPLSQPVSICIQQVGEGVGALQGAEQPRARARGRLTEIAALILQIQGLVPGLLRELGEAKSGAAKVGGAFDSAAAQLPALSGTSNPNAEVVQANIPALQQAAGAYHSAMSEAEAACAPVHQMVVELAHAIGTTATTLDIQETAAGEMSERGHQTINEGGAYITFLQSNGL